MRRETRGCSDECVAIGINLKNIRLRTGLSQECFAERVGVSRQTVVNWERGKSLPSADKITHIIKEFSLSLEDIFSDTVPYVCNESRSEEEPAEKQAVDEIAACEEEAVPCAEKKNNKKKIVLFSVVGTLVLCAIGFMFSIDIIQHLLYKGSDAYSIERTFSLDFPYKVALLAIVVAVILFSASFYIIKQIKLRREKK